METKYGACAIGEEQYSLQDLVLFLDPAICNKYNSCLSTVSALL